MNSDLPISPAAAEIVADLQHNGFETYIVGGAIRDILLGRTPKDFDIATAATPEEVRAFFGRRRCRIIGKRFRLAHVLADGQLFEVSTFRRAPNRNQAMPHPEKVGLDNTNLITADNDFGTAEEDAFRRDFTVNALFYDPVKKEIVDLTRQGLEDIERRKVRAIGDPALRFEEDPVRMLRALKLVAQFDFDLDNATENALFPRLKLLSGASISRLSLELEKILLSTYGDRHLEVFHDYGLLKYFLPELEKRWATPERELAFKLLFERNCRVDEHRYRNSISLACALLALPLVNRELGAQADGFFRPDRENRDRIEPLLCELFAPLPLMLKLRLASARIISLLPEFFRRQELPKEFLRNHVYGHAREAAIIYGIVSGQDAEKLAARWPLPLPETDRPPRRRRERKPRRK